MPKLELLVCDKGGMGVGRSDPDERIRAGVAATSKEEGKP